MSMLLPFLTDPRRIGALADQRLRGDHGLARAALTVWGQVRRVLSLSRLLSLLASFSIILAPCASKADSRHAADVSFRARPKIADADAFMRANTPRAPRPDTVRAPAMPHTPAKQAREMTRRTPKSEITGLAWTQIPGAASDVAGSPDGSLWAVGIGDGGPYGNDIYHYVNGTWTGIPGAATRLSVAPDGSLWAINGLGGIYHLENGVWSQIGGGANDISVGPDSAVYVVSSVPGNVLGNAIFRYANGAWTQIPGEGVHVAASWDINSYRSGITPGGVYVTNAQGSIFYYNPSSGYVSLSGAATQLAPTVDGGLFALGYPASATYGELIYYNDLSTGNWAPEAGAGTSIATTNYNVYVTGAAGGIYGAPVNSVASGQPLSGPGFGPYGGWGPPAVASALQYPVQAGFDGSGSTVAIVMSSNVYASDLAQYLQYFAIPTTSRALAVELVDGASGVPNSDGDPEASLDVETVAGLAPGANVLLYVIPSLTVQAEVDAYNAILSDGVARVASSSFGGCEFNGTVAGLSSIFQAGANIGVAFVAASGDSGSACFYGFDSAGKALYETGVTYPASDPNVTGVGGNETQPPDPLTSNVVWNDDDSANGQEASGGGISGAFAIPSYQQGLAGAASAQNRNVPDVAMPAGDTAIIDGGEWDQVNGTSWAAPQYAALLAEVYQYCATSFGSPASVPYFVYSRASYRAFIDVVGGNNQFSLESGPTPAYYAAPGYDNASGIGIPLGVPFAQTLCPNRVPAFAARVQRSARGIGGFSISRAGTFNATPKIQNLVDLGRKTRSDQVRIQLVLKPGPAVAGQEQAVINLLRAAGFSIVKTFKNHLVVDAASSSGNVEQFFHTRIDNVWQHRPRAAYMPVTPVAIPASLAQYIAGISLDSVENMTYPRGLRRLRSNGSKVTGGLNDPNSRSTAKNTGINKTFHTK